MYCICVLVPLAGLFEYTLTLTLTLYQASPRGEGPGDEVMVNNAKLF